MSYVPKWLDGKISRVSKELDGRLSLSTKRTDPSQDAIKRRFYGVLLRNNLPIAQEKKRGGYAYKGEEPPGLVVHTCLYCLSFFVIPSVQE